jgi:hypothetical protein
MKPGEFDELVRQKFDQGDFAYNARNWERLAEQMDGRAKKRSMLMWLWMPATGMAASVALAIGVTSLFHLDMQGNKTGSGYAATGEFLPRGAESNVIAMVPDVPHQGEPAPVKSHAAPVKNMARVRQSNTAVVVNNGIGLKLKNIADRGQQSAGGNKYAGTDYPNIQVVETNVNAAPAKVQPPKVDKKATVAVVQPMETFREHQNKPVEKKKTFSFILSGGINQGSNNSGYMAGATVRKMINDRVYVESDIAYASSDNVQRTKVMTYESSTSGATGGIGSIAGKIASASKVSDADGAAVPVANTPKGVIKTQDISYNLSYAQVTPGIGVKLMKRMSVGVGPDFQAMLHDNRPATSTVDRENIAVAPTFDVGFVGKTEVSFTNRIKAAVAYRKGVNGVINPSGKFIDRDYLQFQMKCAIFNR